MRNSCEIKHTLFLRVTLSLLLICTHFVPVDFDTTKPICGTNPYIEIRKK